MKNKKTANKIITAILTGIIILAMAFPAFASEPVDFSAQGNWPEGPSISSRSAYVLEMNSNQVLFAKNADEERYPASITKILTALVVLENCTDLTEPVTFSHQSVTDLEEGGYDGRFKEGLVLTVEECLYGLMLDSVNECGYALAEHFGGTVDGFTEMMNKKATEIGCTNSNFVNPHGLNNEQHRTTAHDMALIFAAAVQNEDFLRIDGTPKYIIEKTDSHGQFTFTMHHSMMQKSSNWYSEYVKAGKTGYTSIAKHTLATYAEKDGAKIICICMKESEGGDEIYTDTKALLSYAYNNFSLADISTQTNDIIMGLNAASPIQIENTGLRNTVYLPGAAEGVNVTYTPADASCPGGTAFKLTLVTGNGFTVNEYLPGSYEGIINPPSDNVIDPQEPESQAPEEDPEKEETAKLTFGKVVLKTLKILLWIVIIAIILILGYWVVIQIIKAKRRKRYLERMNRRAHMQKIRQKHVNREDSGDDLLDV